MKTIVISGAGGFIGSHVVINLLNCGCKVYGIDVSESYIDKFKKYENFIPIIASFKDYCELDKRILEPIDLFYHFAWNGVFGESFKDYELQLSNAKYSCDALMLAIKLNCKKFVFAGTVNEYEIKKYIDKDAYFEPRYTCLYASTKLATEMICKTIAFNSNIQYSAGLIAMTYGEGNKSKMLPNVLIDNLNCGNPTDLVIGTNIYDMIYVEDVAEAFRCIGFEGKNMQSYYVGHRLNELKSFRTWVEEIRDIVNPSAELRFGVFPTSLDMDYSLINVNKLYEDTSFTIKSDFKVSIIKTANWLKEIK